MDETRALAVMASLANETRLRVFRQLVTAGTKGMNAGEIAEGVGATPSRASFHLANLAEAGLVCSARRSRQITYWIDMRTMSGLVRYLIEDCCQNDPSVRKCCG